MIVITEE